MNRPSPFPGQMLTKPGFCFFVCVYFVLLLCFWYFVRLGIFGLFLFCVASTSAIDCLEDRPRNELLCVKRDVKQLLTHAILLCSFVQR